MAPYKIIHSLLMFPTLYEIIYTWCYIPKKFLSPGEKPQLTIQLCGTFSVLQVSLKKELQAP